MRLVIYFGLMLTMTFSAKAQGSDLGWLQGEVKDAKTGMGLPFARIEVLCGPDLWNGMTDYDGRYVIRVPYGPFVVSVVADGYAKYVTTGTVEPTTITFHNVDLEKLKKAR